MEAIALFGSLGLGYLITKLSGKKENFDSQQREEQQKQPTTPLFVAEQGNSVKGSPQELNMQYQTRYNGQLPSEPNRNPGPRQNAFDYATQSQPRAYTQPTPQPIQSATSQVTMNAGSVEDEPNYMEGFEVQSHLTGQTMSSSDFTHNNMVPFFGSRVRQNVAVDTNTGILDSYTGSGVNQIQKKEVETMFNTGQTPFGNPFGLENSTAFIESRIDLPRNRGGEKPFEPVRVGAGVGERFGSTGKGGFQQMEVNQLMMEKMPKTDDLRTTDNPKLTYKQPVVPGQHFVTNSAESSGEVRKYKPDTFYIDQTGERFIGAFAQDAQKEGVRPTQVFKHQTRPETSSELIGPAASQEFGESYVTGSYKTPMAQQYGGAGYRNADMTSYYTGNTDAAEADYGRSSIEIRPNERLATSERTMGLNLTPAETGAVPTHYTDKARPTYRGETIGNIRQTGTPVGYAQGAPALTVWSDDVARTTVKEGTVNWNYLGVASSASQPNKLKVYDPDDIAKPTQKGQISAKSEYYGVPTSAQQDFTDHTAAYNMRTNPVKEKMSKGRKPMAGNGSIAIFTGDVYQTSKKIDADILNDRANAVNRSMDLPPGSADIGEVRYRVPLKLDISNERNQREMISAVENNPLQQSIFKNAQHDEALYQDLLKSL
uniref:Uncharacterized protein n=1 Tax=viral metagenome TaxID=1070528 RepID=A0A6C0IE02_9ZZZZ